MQTETAHAIASRLVQQVGHLRTLRSPKVPGWKRLHAAADLYEPRLKKHIYAAFKKAAAALGELPRDEFQLEVRMSDVMLGLERDLRTGLEALLMHTVHAGADAAATGIKTTLRASQRRTLRGLLTHVRTLGEGAGHEFHGNQYTGGGGSSESKGDAVKSAHHEALEKQVMLQVAAMGMNPAYVEVKEYHSAEVRHW